MKWKKKIVSFSDVKVGGWKKKIGLKRLWSSEKLIELRPKDFHVKNKGFYRNGYDAHMKFINRRNEVWWLKKKKPKLKKKPLIFKNISYDYSLKLNLVTKERKMFSKLTIKGRYFVFSTVKNHMYTFISTVGTQNKREKSEYYKKNSL